MTHAFTRTARGRRRALAGLLSITLVSCAAAAPVFPPAPHATNARFDEGTASPARLDPPWYHLAGSRQRARLAAAEVAQSPRHPSLYYFIALRASANDEQARLAAMSMQAVTAGSELAVKAGPDAAPATPPERGIQSPGG